MNILTGGTWASEHGASCWPADGLQPARPQQARPSAPRCRGRLGIGVRARGRYAVAADAAPSDADRAARSLWVEHLGPRHILESRLGRRAGQGGGAAPTVAVGRRRYRSGSASTRTPHRLLDRAEPDLFAAIAGRSHTKLRGRSSHGPAQTQATHGPPYPARSSTAPSRRDLDLPAGAAARARSSSLDAGARWRAPRAWSTSAYNELLAVAGEPGGRRLSTADDRVRGDAEGHLPRACIPATPTGGRLFARDGQARLLQPRGRIPTRSGRADTWTPQTYLTAPSSHNDFYNAHPGGLAVTVAYNIRMADAYTENYRQMYGLADQPRPAGGVALRPRVSRRCGSTSGWTTGRGWRSRAPSMTTPGTPTASTSPPS